ncbi:hypothetical protein MC7420_2033 [Coleofasciculus chthonoplastes PCC 7420]|uniref:Uncharacterized protein n=1 Tax=Coleofasciculus chthonoplastes PCC 7420 TaxID=118168 RepID=B4VN33_9CYAN|nr:hypothetical protein MC7420_2033 [Coleofasciculus chthonoplastes PCC 7420]
MQRLYINNDVSYNAGESSRLKCDSLPCRFTTMTSSGSKLSKKELDWVLMRIWV